MLRAAIWWVLGLASALAHVALSRFYCPSSLNELPESIATQVREEAAVEASLRHSKSGIYQRLRAREIHAYKRAQAPGWVILTASTILCGAGLAVAHLIYSFVEAQRENANANPNDQWLSETDAVALMIFVLSVAVSSALTLASTTTQRFRWITRILLASISLVFGGSVFVMVVEAAPSWRITVVLGVLAMVIPILLDIVTPRSETLSWAQRRRGVVPYGADQAGDDPDSLVQAHDERVRTWKQRLTTPFRWLRGRKAASAGRRVRLVVGGDVILLDLNRDPAGLRAALEPFKS